MSRALDVTTSYLVTTFRFPAGLVARPNRARPEKPFELYEFEACPFCRKVREALSELDLDAIVYPCPKNGHFREVVKQKTGKTMFPFLIDPNTGTEMLESSDIVRYLEKTYGPGSVSWPLAMGPLTNLSSMIASAARPGHGRSLRRSRRPEKLLELWSFEASPYCRLAREALCELEIPYLLHNVAKRGQMRRAFIERSGKMRVPYLYDPNTGKEMFESADIVRYLNAEYAKKPWPYDQYVPVLRQFLDRFPLAGISGSFGVPLGPPRFGAFGEEGSHQMIFSGSRLTWPQIRSTEAFQGCWVALDQCRYEEGRPSEGTVVDFDPDLAALCDRMREADSRHCAIVFCEQLDDTPIPSSRPPARLTPIPGSRQLRH